MKLSVVISTYNRSASLRRTIMSIKALASEIIVIDNESGDDTKKVAESLGAVVFQRPNNLMLNVNKNYGFSKTNGDWILSLDDDEEVPSDLTREIKESIRVSGVAGYWIPRKNIIFGRWIQHGIWWPDRQLRLFRKGAGKFPEQHVHEYIEVIGTTKTLTHPYIHYNYDSIAQYLDKMQRVYTESEVQKHVAAGYSVRWQDAVRFPMSDFIKLYFAESGYKDGLHGLVLAILQAFYSFLIFVKLWEREQFRPMDIDVSRATEELTRSATETRYWIDTVRMRESTNVLGRLWYRLLRKIHRSS